MSIEIDLSELCSRQTSESGVEAFFGAFGDDADLPSPNPDGPWVAGGCLRRLILRENPWASDVDYFFKSTGQAEAFEKTLLSRGFTKAFDSETATTYVKAHGSKKTIVQAVKIQFYESLDAVLESFDFTLCQIGWDGETARVGQFALWDIGRKHIVLHRVTYAAATIRRLIKYSKQGFTVCDGTIAKILTDVVADPSIIHAEVDYVD